MKRSFALALCAAAVLVGLAGCGGKKKDTAGPSPVGTWQAEVDLTGAVNALSEAGGMGEFFTAEDLVIPVTLELKEDNTYALTLEEETLTRSIGQVKTRLKEGATAYLEGVIRDRELNVTVEGSLAQAGTSLDKLLDEIFTSDALAQATRDLRAGGQYRTEEGRLYLSDSAEQAPGDSYVDYTLSGDTLRLSRSTGGPLDAVTALTFHRVSPE